jgi:hypothetical protein
VNCHPSNRLAVSLLVPIMVKRWNGTRGAKAGKSATRDTGVPRLTSVASETAGDLFHAINGAVAIGKFRGAPIRANSLFATKQDLRASPFRQSSSDG